MPSAPTVPPLAASFACAAATAGVSGRPGVDSRPFARESLRSRCRLFWNQTWTCRAETLSFCESSRRVSSPARDHQRMGRGEARIPLHRSPQRQHSKAQQRVRARDDREGGHDGQPGLADGSSFSSGIAAAGSGLQQKTEGSPLWRNTQGGIGSGGIHTLRAHSDRAFQGRPRVERRRPSDLAHSTPLTAAEGGTERTWKGLHLVDLLED